MAFALDRKGSTGRQLRKLVQKELETAIGALDSDDPDEAAIHEARKSVKKSRAVLRLLRAHLGPAYGRENRRLRDAAHLLASLRDADATTETLQALHGRYTNVVTPRIASHIDRGLRGRRRRARRRAARRVSLALSAIRRAHASAPAKVGKAGHFAAVRRGVTQAYRGARRAMEGLGPDADAAALHLWRRRVKDHWYHVRLFGRVHAAVSRRVRALERLEEWLGTDHDLAALEGLILAARDQFGAARETAIVLGCITKYQQHLRMRAIRQGKGLFAQKPRDFSRTVTGWWAGA